MEAMSVRFQCWRSGSAVCRGREWGPSTESGDLEPHLPHISCQFAGVAAWSCAHVSTGHSVIDKELDKVAESLL